LRRRSVFTSRLFSGEVCLRLDETRPSESKEGRDRRQFGRPPPASLSSLGSASCRDQIVMNSVTDC
jgi:hypothetical protein